MSIVPTKAALALKNAESNFQVVKFEAHKPKKKHAEEENIIVNTKTKQTVHPKKDLDLKQIRHEIVKFGMSGFDTTKKEQAKIALAVSLGAIPPKREYVNYKELMQKQKEEKDKREAEKMLMISRGILSTGVKKKKKKANNDVGYLLSSYGKVQKKDLKKDDSKDKGKRKKKQKLI
ncbi:uncharacterized protein C1orf131 homolog [Maniola hyperantus]|uniref:uncharacterized protein C1orf131 homolog n=1 Tax=Aphantopus hyperantus TaxID=2795564 RepID=UPI00156A0662|nr:uncharacterized protein C1orf131 homolog [Maniola hyperantus]